VDQVSTRRAIRAFRSNLTPFASSFFVKAFSKLTKIALHMSLQDLNLSKRLYQRTLAQQSTSFQSPKGLGKKMTSPE
jgi:hypothetical protein